MSFYCSSEKVEAEKKRNDDIEGKNLSAVAVKHLLEESSRFDSHHHQENPDECRGAAGLKTPQKGRMWHHVSAEEK